MFKLNYRAMLSDQIGVVLGPNAFGERLEVVNQMYDINTNTTTLELKVYRGQ